MRQFIQQYRALFLSLFLLLNGSIDAFSQNVLDRAGLPVTSSLAYSLRKLSNNYTGYAVQVRRSSDNALANVSFDANGMVSSSSTIDGTTNTFQSFFGTSSCFVQTWYDQSGNNRHASQPNTTKQPMIVNAGVFNVLNNKPALNFNGTSSVMNIPMPASVINTTGAISTVLKTAQLQQQFEALLSWSSSASPYGPGFGPQNSIASGKFGLYTTWGPFNLSLGPVTANTDYVLNASWTGQTVTQSRNGTITTGAMGAAFSTNVSSGYMGQDNPNSGYFAGIVPEIIVFSTELGTTNRAALESNQNQFYFPPIIPATGPAGINNGIAMWLDAADIDADGIAGNNPTLNTNFTTWKDKSGYARNATSLNTLNPITYIPNEINGNPVARFTRVNDVVGSAMQVANMDIRSVTNPEITMFTVYKTGAKGSNGQGQALWGNDNGAWDRFFYNSWNFSDNGIVSLGLGNPNFANISGAGITGKTQLMTAVFKSGVAGGSAIYFNGAVVTNFTDNTDPSAALTSLRIGSDGDNGMFNGDIAEFIVYNRKLTNCEILQVNQYLGAKYGVTFTTATITAPATTVCSGTAAALTASAGDSYQWFKDGAAIASATAQTYNATASGSYTVAITTSGCTATSLGTVITVNTMPTISITNATPSINLGSTATLAANSGGGNALKFNGANTYVDLGTGVILPNTFTQEAWIYSGSGNDGAFHGFLGYQPAGSSATRSPSMWIYNGTAIHGGFGDGTNFYYYITQPGQILQNTWNHIAQTFDGTTLRCYVNGVLATNATYVDPIGKTPNTTYGVRNIGRVDNYFKGDIDEVRMWNIVRTPAQILADMNKGIPTSSTGLVGYWKMDEGTGTSTVDAKAGTVGTLTNTPLWTVSSAPIGGTIVWTPSTGLNTTVGPIALATPSSTTTYTATATDATSGCAVSANTIVTVNQPATALNLDGTNDFVKIADNAGLDFGANDFTVETWTMKLNNSSGYKNSGLVGKWNTGSTPGSNEWILNNTATGNDNKAAFLIESGNTIYQLNSTTDLPLNTWYHVAVVRKGTTLSMYINGLFNNSINIPAGTIVNNVGRDVLIGAYLLSGVNPTIFSKINIDELRIWNRALCISEIQNNRNGELSGTQTGLTAYYKFNQGFINGSNSGITALNDVSGNNNNGTLINFATAATTNWIAGTVTGSSTVFVPATSAITGTTTVCQNATITLSNANSGVWNSSNTAVATIDAAGIVTGVSAGTSIISFTNDCGGISTITITVDPLPTITGTLVACATRGRQLTGSGTPAVNNPWTSSNTSIATVNSTGFVTAVSAAGGSVVITYTNSNGCSITANFTVPPLPPTPTVSVVNNCDGTSTLTASGYTSYQWAIVGGPVTATSTSITVSTAGTYGARSVSSQCVSSFAYGIAAPKTTPVVNITADGSTSVCIGNTVTFHANTGAEGEQINWYDAATGGNLLFTGNAYTTPSLTATTTYYAEAINTTTGCTSATRTAITATISTLPVVANITGANAVCETVTTQLSNTTTGGVWTSSNTALATVDATGKVTGVQAGTVVIAYTVTNATGCSTTKTYSVTVKLKPAMPVIIGETTGCLGTTLVLTATSDAPNPSFRWCNTPTANPVRTFLLEYSASLCVNVTSNGCSSDQIIVPVVAKPLPAATITALGTTSFCAGSSVQLNASTATGNTYQWKLNGNNISGATAATYVANATGNYTVAVTAVNTCTVTSSAITVNATDNVAPGSTAIQFTAPADILSNVAEAAQYNLAYELNVPEYGNYSVVNPTYTVNNAAQLQNIPLDRIAYYMQLNNKWVWVSMDAFTNNVSLTGIPVTNTVWQQKVNNMNVFSSANAGVTNGTGIATGNIEMWKFNYAPNINLGLPGASSSAYDYDDRPEVNGNHGSFQVHNYGIGQTIFGYSRFGQNGRGEIGIGNNTLANGGNGGQPDWTFNQNANIYSTKKIYVFVKPKAQVIAKDATIYLDANGVAVVPVTAVDNGVIDNCSTVTRTVSPAQFTSANLGANTVTVTLTDASGNSNTGTSVVTVVDNIKPVINCNNNLDVYATSSAGAIVNYVLPTATDNSGNATITLVSGIASGSIFPIGTTTVTYKATDASGNFAECSFTVTVSGVAPVVIAPVNITLNNTPGSCGAAVTFAATEITAIPASTITYSIAPGSNFAIGTTTVTATATNAVGSNAATFTVTVIDTENPTIIAPVAVGVPTDLNSNTASNVILGAPVTSDNCAVASVSNNAPTVYPIGTTTVTWTVIDIHGNRSTASQEVTVSDQQAPTVNTQNITVYLNASGTATITADQINNGSTDNTSIATYALNASSFSCATAGEQMVVLTVTDIYGNAASANALVTILDAIAPSVTAVANQTFCANVSGSNYTIAALSATDNCTITSVTYTVTGATNRTGVGYDASGAFSIGTSVIKWTVTDASGNATSSSTTVKVNPLPVATITAPTADALCNQFVLTANTASAYQWMFNNTTSGSLPTLTLGLTNGDGVYSLFITDANGCKSATAATYNYQKQNLVNSYTILASKEVKLGKYNKVASGSVGITSAKGEAEFKKFSSVNGAGSFVKSPKIKKDGTGVLIANSINGIATVTLPTMQLNNANTQNLASYTVSQNTTQTLSANYKTLTIKKGANVTVTGNSFGKIKVEEGASIRFTAATINMEQLDIDKGAKNGSYSFVRFAPNSSIRVTDKVNIGSRVRVNEESYKVTFYLRSVQNGKGRDEDDDDDNGNASFSVKGSDTRVIANVIMPGGKLKVISNESDDDKDLCSHSAHNAKDCRHKNHEHNDCNHTSHSAASCNDDVYMTGLFVAAEVESEGNIVIWNSYDCSAPASISTNNEVSALAVLDEVKFTPVIEQAELNVIVMPNPSTTYFTLKLESKNEAPVNIRVVDALGRLVDVKTKMGANSTFQIGHNYSSGTYFVELLQGNKRKVIQLIKTRG